MQQMKVLSFLFILLSIPGCSLLGGDLLVNVKGSTPMIGPEMERGDCTLFAVDAKNNERWGRMEQVALPDFFGMMMIVVSCSKRPYYFIAECQDGRTFRSHEVVLGGSNSSNYYKNPLDVGTPVEISQ